MCLGSGSPRGCPPTTPSSVLFPQPALLTGGPWSFRGCAANNTIYPHLPPLKGLTQFFKGDFSHPISGLNLNKYPCETGRTSIMITLI